jgi:hypothetical protein
MNFLEKILEKYAGVRANDESSFQFTVRKLTKEEYAAEFPEETDQEQEMPETDVEEDREDEDNDETKESASNQLADVMRRLANNQARTDVRDISQLHVTERRVNEPAKAPEATRKPSETADALTKAIQRLRESA